MRYSNTLVHYSGKINEEKRKIFWNKKWNSNQNLLNTFKNLRFYFSCFESCVTSIKEDSGFQVRDGNLKWKAISMTEGTIHVEHTCDNSSAYRFWRWNYLSLLKSSCELGNHSITCDLDLQDMENTGFSQWMWQIKVKLFWNFWPKQIKI